MTDASEFGRRIDELVRAGSRVAAAWWLGALGLAAWGLAGAPLAGADEPSRFEVEYRPDIEFGTGGGQKLLLDLAVPKDAPPSKPGLILIHGGGWTGGNRKDFVDVAKETAALGFVSATIEYRLAPRHPWPAQIEDCKCAVRWMRAHGGELGVDPQRIGTLGGSAGGHLALLLGTMGSEDGHEGDGGWQEHSSRVQAVVDFFGPTDLFDEYAHAKKGQALAKLIKQEINVLDDFLGGGPEGREELYRQASPISYVNRGDAPTLILQGTHDLLVPYEQSVKMAAALAKARVPGRLELIFGAGHGWDGSELERTKAIVFAFCREHLGEPR